MFVSLSRNQFTELTPDIFEGLGTIFYVMAEMHLLRLLPPQLIHFEYIISKNIVQSEFCVLHKMAQKYPDDNLHQALANIIELNKLQGFSLLSANTNDYHPLARRLVLLCQYVRCEADLEKYRFYSLQELQNVFHLRCKLEIAAKHALRNHLPDLLVWSLSEYW